MSSVDNLPPDQRAVLQMVLQRGYSYDDIAALLSIDRASVRRRALDALDALGPTNSIPAAQRAILTDYLLGQLPDLVVQQVRQHLAASPSDRAWARVISAQVGDLSNVPMPEIPIGSNLPDEPPASRAAAWAALADEHLAASGELPSAPQETVPEAPSDGTEAPWAAEPPAPRWYASEQDASTAPSESFEPVAAPPEPAAAPPEPASEPYRWQEESAGHGFETGAEPPGSSPEPPAYDAALGEYGTEPGAEIPGYGAEPSGYDADLRSYGTEPEPVVVPQPEPVVVPQPEPAAFVPAPEPEDAVAAPHQVAPAEKPERTPGGAQTPPAGPAGDAWAPPLPIAEPGARTERSSRFGGAVVLALLAIAVVVVVVVLLLNSGANKTKLRATGSVPSTTTTTQTQTTTPTTTTPTTTTSTTPVSKAQAVYQVNLNPPKGGVAGATGVAEVLKSGRTLTVVVVAQGVPANTVHNAYAVWLYNSPTSEDLLGFLAGGVGASHRLQAESPPLPRNARIYKQLLVTIETQGKPKVPGKVILAGAFRT